MDCHPSFRAIRGPSRADYASDSDYAIASDTAIADVRDMLASWFGGSTAAYHAPSPIGLCTDPAVECVSLGFAVRSASGLLCTRWPSSEAEMPADVAAETRTEDGHEYVCCPSFSLAKQQRRDKPSPKRSVNVKQPGVADGNPRKDAIRAWLIAALLAATVQGTTAPPAASEAAHRYLADGHADDDMALVLWLREHARRHPLRRDRGRERHNMVYLAAIAVGRRKREERL